MPWLNSIPSMLLAVLLVPGALIAQEEASPPLFRHEISFGLGVASPSEKHPLNVPGERKLSPALALSLLYRYYINSYFSAGVQMVGYTGKTPTYSVQKEGESTARDLSFTLTCFDVGVQLRYTLFQDAVCPYAFALVNYVAGSLQNDEAGTLNQTGFSAGGGIGVAWMISHQVALSLEGIGVFGNATWKQRPFVNSTGTEYDPSWIGALVSASYFWGN